MQRVRILVYRLGFRPKPGSIFFSPSLAFRDLPNFAEAFAKEMKSVDTKEG